MKICYASNYLPGCHVHAGGAEQAISKTASLVKEKGAEVSFLTLAPGKGRRVDAGVNPVPVIETFFAGAKKYVEIVKWYIFQFDPLAYFASKRYLARTRPDVIHLGNFQFLTFSVLLAAKRLKIPVVMSVYDYWCFCPLTTLFDYKKMPCRRFHGTWCARCLPAGLRAIQIFFLMFRKKLFDHFLNKVDRFIVLSESSRRILLDYGIEQNKISVIRPAFPADFAETGTAAEDGGGYILFAGWLQRRKGLHVLLDAMSMVWDRMPSAKLYIATQKVKWEKEYEGLINSKLKDAPKDGFALLSGNRKDQINELIRRADIVVVPEQWENMSPLIVIEAMSMSRPVVASNLGGIPEYVEDNRCGLLAEHSNPADFAEKIITLLNNKEMRETLGRNANKKITEMLNKENIANQYIQAYEKSRVS